MRPVHLAPSLLLAVLGSTACRSTANVDFEPLASGEAVPVEYESSVSYAGALARGFETSAVERPGPGTEVVDIDVRFVSLPRDVARRLFVGAPTALGGWRVSGAEAEAVLDRLVEAGVATPVNDSRLAVYVGQQGSLSVVNQMAYISGFDVEKGADSLLADPVIGVLHDGLIAKVRPTPSADGSVHLDLEVAMVSVQKPIRTSRALVPGTHHPVTLQLPVASRQDLRAAFQLAEGDCAVLSGIDSVDPDQRLLAFVRTRPFDPAQAGAAAAPSPSAARAAP